MLNQLLTYCLFYGILLLGFLVIHRLTVWGEATTKRQEEEAAKPTCELEDEKGEKFLVYLHPQAVAPPNPAEVAEKSTT